MVGCLFGWFGGKAGSVYFLADHNMETLGIDG